MDKSKYPLIIIGAGPAGLTASVYASRYKIDHLVIGKSLGGLASEAHKVCNFPTEKEISGMEITKKMQKHAESLSVSLVMDKIVDVDQEKEVFEVTTQGRKKFSAKALLLAVGTEHRRLNLPDEKKFIGKGVSYCATCDAMFYRDKTVAVVGGANSANTASLYLAEIAKKVYQIYRKGKLRGDAIWIDQITKNKKIEVIYNTKVVGLKGKEELGKIILSAPYKGQTELAVNGLFAEIGTIPQKDLINQLSLETDENGYIKVGSDQKTSREGVWAAGDITTASNNFHQILTACSEGAIASDSIFKFLQEKKR
jgi:thioredoxin reductase (NADPH)